VHQHHQAIRRCLLEVLELSHGCIALRAGGFDVPACLLVLVGGRTMSLGDLTLQVLGSTLQLLGSQLEHPDAIGRHQALGKDVPFLFLMGLAQEAQLVVHAAPGREKSRGFMGDKR
jgi:hypothetical protein